MLSDALWFKQQRFSLFAYGQELKSTESERDLDIIFSKNLKMKNQVISWARKANQKIGIIRKSFAHLDSKFLRSLFVTFTRPL